MCKNLEKEIHCEACGKDHPINDLTLIQTHWYTRPFSCFEGDYWNEGEVQFVCPDNDVRNRLLFNIPYEERDNFKKNPESQFKRNYKPHFKEVIEEYDSQNYNSVNNYFVDNNREKFGLVKKKN